MKTREETAGFIRKQLHWSHNCSRKKGGYYHYGMQELRELLDFIYGGIPEKETEYIYEGLDDRTIHT